MATQDDQHEHDHADHDHGPARPGCACPCCAGHDIARLFAERGIRCTRQRVDIYAALRATKAHPTAEELHGMVSDAVGVSLATVYNTLEALSSVGLCHKLPTNDGPARYDADLSEHMHLVHPDGSIVDVPEDLGERILRQIPPDLIDELEVRMGVRVRRLSVNAICGDADRRL